MTRTRRAKRERTASHDTNKAQAKKIKSDVTIQKAKISTDLIETLSVFNTQTGQVEQYKPDIFLGAGSYGTVRKFTYNGNALAVKMPRNPKCLYEGNWLDKKEFNHVWREIKNEYHALNRAYPNEGPYTLQRLEKKKGDGVYYTYCMTMPCVAGKVLWDYIKTAPSEKLALLFLECAKELNRIHELGVIHGDIKINNILVNEIADTFDIHFIDFGYAYYPNQINPTLDVGDNFAPEISNHESQTYIGHTSQDVYALARMFDDEMECADLGGRHAVGHSLKMKEFQQFFSMYPSIKSFMQSALKTNPAERPTLPEFIARLSNDIEQIKKQSNKLMQSPATLFRPRSRKHVTSSRESDIDKLSTILKCS